MSAANGFIQAAQDHSTNNGMHLEDLDHVINCLDFGLIVLNLDRTILKSNDVARELTGGVPGNQLVIAVSQERKRLDDVIRQGHHSASMRLTFNHKPQVVNVIPRWRGLANDVLLMFERQSAVSRSDLDYLQSEYELTAAELSIVAALCIGHVPKKIAQDRKVSVHTVRTHIKHILLKTDAQTTTDLIRQVALLPKSSEVYPLQ